MVNHGRNMKITSHENLDNKKQPFGHYVSERLLDEWCPDSESNQGHEDFQSSALGIPHIQLFNWWAIRDLNPGPAGYEPDALTN